MYDDLDELDEFFARKYAVKFIKGSKTSFEDIAKCLDLPLETVKDLNEKYCVNDESSKADA